MVAFDFYRYFLVLIVPGMIGALAYSITARFRTEINLYVAFILDLLVFTTMITGLYFFQNVVTVSDLLIEFECLSFTRNYILLSTFIAIVYGVIFGFLRRIFFWLRR